MNNEHVVAHQPKVGTARYECTSTLTIKMIFSDDPFHSKATKDPALPVLILHV